MEFNLEDALVHYENENNITEAAKKHCKDIGIPYEQKYRLRLSRLINSERKEEENLQSEVNLSTSRCTKLSKSGGETEVEGLGGEMFNMPSAWAPELNRFYGIEEYCEKFNLDYSKLIYFNLVAHNAGHMIFNVRFKQTLKDVEGIDEEFIEKVVNSHINNTSWGTPELIGDECFDRLVVTDIHIGMSTEGGRNVTPLYDDVWDEEVLFKRLDAVISHVVEFRRGDVLVIDELGDYMDGLLGETTRKGHHLPQNMSDKEAFEIGIRFKIEMIERLKPYYNRIICNNIVEDNHAGVYGYFINSTVKKIVELKYPNRVTFNILNRFINHYSMGQHTFILSHGKDSESLKFGFKPILDAKQADKIDQYCKEHKLYNGNSIEFSKGDSHQFLMDYSTSNDFDYCNYPAFSPPSNWVKSNFGKSLSGAVLQNIFYSRNLKIQNPLIF